MTPTTGTLLANSAQPVTLVVQNAVASIAGTTYNFEVATDAAFSNKVQTKTGVAEGTGGQTSATLIPLAAGSGLLLARAGDLRQHDGPRQSAAFKFTIGALVTISAPTAVAPGNGSTAATQPMLTVANSTSTGPAGVIAYRFDISTSANFATIAVSGSVVQGTAGQTSFTPGSTLSVSTTYYWRAVAIDQTNLVTSPASATASFTTVSFSGVAAGIANQLGQILWPGKVPSGTNGQAVLGNNCDGTANWGPTTCFSPTGQVNFPSPTIEMLRFFDLFDRGYDPQSAINWMNANGYPTSAQWYPPPTKAVLGLQYVYLAARYQYLGPGAIWDIVISLG